MADVLVSSNEGDDTNFSRRRDKVGRAVNESKKDISGELAFGGKGRNDSRNNDDKSGDLSGGLSDNSCDDEDGQDTMMGGSGNNSNDNGDKSGDLSGGLSDNSCDDEDGQDTMMGGSGNDSNGNGDKSGDLNGGLSDDFCGSDGDGPMPVPASVAYIDSINDPTVVEGQKEVFTIKLGGDLSKAHNVLLTLTNEDALAGRDYNNELEASFDNGATWKKVDANSLSVAANVQQFQVRVATIDNMIMDGDRVFNLTAAVDGDSYEATATILDNDVACDPVPPTPEPASVAYIDSINDPTVVEGQKEVFTVKLGGDLSKAHNVSLSLQNEDALAGRDYNNELEASFDNGATWQKVNTNGLSVAANVQQFQVRVATIDNLIMDGDRVFNLTASVDGDSYEATATILDNDVACEPVPPTPEPAKAYIDSINDPTVVEGQKEVFTIKLGGDLSKAHNVSLTLTNEDALAGQDYNNELEASFNNGTTWQKVNANSLSVAANVEQFQVRVATIDNLIVDGDRVFNLTASVDGDSYEATATILDNDVACDPVPPTPEPASVAYIDSINDPTVVEGQKEVFTVKLGGDLSKAHNVSLSLQNEDALAGRDYNNELEASFDNGATWQKVNTNSLSVAANVQQFQVRVATIDNLIMDGDRVFNLTASVDGDSYEATANILDNDVACEPVPPTPEPAKAYIDSINDPTVVEGQKEVFTIKLGGDLSKAHNVSLTLTNEDALAGQDYNNELEASFNNGATWQKVNANSLSVAANVEQFQVRVATIDNLIVDGDRVFNLTASVDGDSYEATATILDNDVPCDPEPPTPEPASIAYIDSINDPTVVEGQKEVFTIKLGGDLSKAHNVSLTLTNEDALAGRDYNNELEASFNNGTTWEKVNANSLSVAANVQEFQVRVATIDNMIMDGDRVFNLTALVDGDSYEATATILDNDTPPAPTPDPVPPKAIAYIDAINDPTVVEGQKEVFTIKLGGDLSQAHNVSLTLTNEDALAGRDYNNELEASFDNGATWAKVNANSLSVAANVQQFQVRVATIDNLIVDGDRVFNLTATVDGDAYEATATILDNDVAPAPTPDPVPPKAIAYIDAINDPTVVEGQKEVFTIKLGGDLSQAHNVSLSLQNEDALAGRDYNNELEASFDNGATWAKVNANSLSVAANVQQFQVRVATIDNLIVDGDRVFNLTATVDGDSYEATATILDNDTPPAPTPDPVPPKAIAYIDAINDPTVVEGQKEVFTIKLGGDLSQAHNVSLTLTNEDALAGRDYNNELEASFDNGATWAKVNANSLSVAANVQQFQVRVATIDNLIVDGDRVFNLTALVDGDSYEATATIQDNDVACDPVPPTPVPTPVPPTPTPDPVTPTPTPVPTPVPPTPTPDPVTPTPTPVPTPVPPTPTPDPVTPTPTPVPTPVPPTPTPDPVTPTPTPVPTPVPPTPTPTPVPALTAQLVGNTSIDEGGKAGSYRIELSAVSNQDRLFTITIGDGTANRIDANKGTVLGNATIASFTGNGQGILENQQVAKSYAQWGDSYWRNVNTAANGYQVTDNKDFSVYKSDGTLNTGNTITVKVAAGQRVSESFQVDAWKENVIAPWALSPDQLAANESLFKYYNQENQYLGTGRNSAEAKAVQEGNETFTLKISDAGGVALANNALNITITDQSKVQYISPIALDLNGDGIQTLGTEEGVLFDILNTGTAVNTGWISSGDAFLAFDQNHNGTIDNRSELFGGGVGEGFDSLASFDSDGNGVVNANDTMFGELQLWQDKNSNGLTDAGELDSLSAFGVTSLNVNHTNTFTEDAQGNILGESSTAIKDGQSIAMIDVYFKLG